MDELYKEAGFVQAGITAYGGGFMRALLGAMQMADSVNLAKIKNTWPEEWAQYVEMGRLKEANDGSI